MSLKNPDSPHGPVFPPQYLRQAYLERFPPEAFQRVETVFALRSATQQITNVLNEWLEGTAGSQARFQTLALLWGAGGRLVPHQDIIAALQVKRATVSALMYSLEQDGLVQSAGDPQDRRRLLAKLTEKGREVITRAMEMNAGRLKNALAGLSTDELVLFQSLLARVRDGFLQQAAAENAGH
ncbi:MarR family winged helix-turn-helix transcriptional regulator [Dyella choica]|uniref:MarR family transcriptional regulator n=1 Tax=Dyella choica TaxID=1927959 RepID=A0A432MB67_9GAMM|nr:MarR family winged helix-turn-helix transcriptional regulator [Dyella choica]RUL79981.1 MarR family transcriptional regulator [Dyella choica]